MGDGFYRSKDPTNSIEVLEEKAVKGKPKKHKENKNYTYAHTQNSILANCSGLSCIDYCSIPHGYC